MGVVAALRDRGDFSADERSLADAFARHFAVALAPRAPAASRYLDGLLEALDEVNRRAASVTRIDELSAMLDPVLASVFGNVRSGLALWDERQDVLRMVSSTFPVDMWQTSLTDLRSSTVRVFLTGTSWVTDRALTDPGVLKDQPVRFEIERLVQIQLNAAGRRIGVLSIAMEDHPSPELLEMIERLAPHLATVVEFARTAARLRQRGDLTASVSAIAVAVANTSKESGLRDLVSGVEDLKRTVGASALVIERDGTHDIVAADPDVADYVARVLADLGEPLSDSFEHSVDISDTSDGCLFVVPIRLSGEHIGTLLALRRSNRFDAEERAALERVASLFALQASSERHWHQRIQLAKVDERERLADDLHDDVVQLLYGIQLNLDLAVESTGEAETHDRLLRSRELAASADKILRQMIVDRSDPVTPELRAGVGEIVERMRRDHGLEIDDTFAGEPRDVPDEVSHLMLRVLRECLTNVAKHASSRHVLLSVAVRPEKIELVISDDGAGVGDQRGVEGYGLASMRRSLARHGGQLTVASTGRGTTVTATVALR
ncbi:sensor histidine kinase [Nocardioides immobilis]|uniref:sensor histidine kinase n=1 Tax=Nocardioides immobilis TaxID=2049295 RepID=UPI0011C3B8B8|nr:ATP-binding protein [Nocardioides immobilis]